MTIILAAVAPKVAVIAADSLRSAGDGSRRQVQKVRSFLGRVVVARGGYGDLADGIWDQIESLPHEVLGNPQKLAVAIQDLAAPIYAECMNASQKLNENSLGLYFFVVGLEEDGTAVVLTVDMAKKELKTFRDGERISVIGLGSIPDAHEVAIAAADPYESALDPRAWTAATVRAGVAKDPATIGFPAFGAIVSEHGIETFTVSGPEETLVAQPAGG